MAFKLQLKCDYCGKIIHKWPCRINKTNYCDIKCRNKALIGRKLSPEHVAKISKSNTGKKRDKFFCEMTRKRQLGNGNSCWKGGISKHPHYGRHGSEKRRYGMTKEEAVDTLGGKCFNCGMSNNESIKLYKKSLSVHHIDGVGRNSSTPNNSISNLQLLCISCHGKVHFTSEIARKLRMMQNK